MENYKIENETKEKITPNDQWLENLRKRNEVNSDFEARALKAKKIDMKDLDYVKIPEKINIIGQPGNISVKPDANVRAANKIHGGAGANFRA